VVTLLIYHVYVDHTLEHDSMTIDHDVYCPQTPFDLTIISHFKIIKFLWQKSSFG
jgi:hypothetical protein